MKDLLRKLAQSIDLQTPASSTAVENAEQFFSIKFPNAELNITTESFLRFS